MATLWDVLEHVVDPVAFLTGVAKLVRPGGHVFANVPDIESPTARLLGRHWPLLLEEHLTYFTARSLRLCDDRAGLAWRGGGRCRASFWLGYVTQRLGKHRTPGSVRLQSQLHRLGVGRVIVAVPLGEMYGAWVR